MAAKSRAQKKQDRQERMKTSARDFYRNEAIQHLMRRDPLGTKLTGLLIQLYKGVDDATTGQALVKHGFGVTAPPLIYQVYGTRPVGDARTSLEADLAACRDALCHKYQIDLLYVLDETLIEDVKAETLRELCEERAITPSQTLDAASLSALQAQFDGALEILLRTCWGPRRGWKALRYTTNWVAAGAAKLVIEAARAYRVELAAQPPPPGDPPTLTVTVDLRKATANDLARLAWAFKEAVKKALQSLPTTRMVPNAVENALAYHLDGVDATDPMHGPPTLTLTLDCSKVNQRALQALESRFKAILREVSVDLPQGPLESKLLQWDKFVRDLRRYDWHRLYEFSFRYIAFLEQQLQEQSGRDGRELEEPLEPPSVEPRQVGEAVLGEDGVEKGVKRIYEAIHRQPYPSPQQQPDAATLDSLQYACPYHPQHDCTEACAYLTRWRKDIRRLLPGDYHGGSREVPVSTTLLDARRDPRGHGQADDLVLLEELEWTTQAEGRDEWTDPLDEPDPWQHEERRLDDEVECLSWADLPVDTWEEAFNAAYFDDDE